MGTIQTSTGKGNNTVNTTTVWDRIVNLENNVGVSGTPIKEKVDALETSLAQNATVVSGLVVGVDNTTVIQNTYNNLTKGQRLIIPSGTWLADKLKFDKDDVEVICLGTLKPLTPTTEYVVMIGKGVTGQFSLRSKGFIKVDSGSDWFTYTGTGVVVYNVNNADLTIDVNGMTKGVELIGDGEGCSYNTFNIIRIFDCQKAVTTTGINHGWSNENNFYNGRYGNNSSKANYNNVVFFDVGNYDYWVADGIKIINPTIENRGKICVFRGNAHVIENARFEMDSAYQVYTDGLIDLTNASYCKITSAYDTLNTFFKYTLTTTATRQTTGKLLIPVDKGDLTNKFYAGAELIITYSDATTQNTIVGTSSYDGVNGTTVWLSDDSQAAKTIQSFTFNCIKNKSSSNKVELMKKRTFAGGVVIPKAEFFEGNSTIPSITAVDNNSQSDIYLLLSYLGQNKLKITYDGAITSQGKVSGSSLGLGLNKIILSDGKPTTGLNTRGDIALQMYPNGAKPSFYICSSGDGTNVGTWLPVGQPVTKSTTANRPALSVENIGFMYMDTTLNANGKPIWWNGTGWVDSTGATV